MHDAFTARAESAPPGSDVQFAAFQASVSTAVNPASLRAILDGDLPAGLQLDSGLRWRVLKRLTTDSYTLSANVENLMLQDKAGTHLSDTHRSMSNPSKG